jgi:hypothetical protein
MISYLGVCVDMHNLQAVKSAGAKLFKFVDASCARVMLCLFVLNDLVKASNQILQKHGGQARMMSVPY